MLLVGRPLIGVAGRNRDADFQFFRQIEEGRDIFRRMASKIVALTLTANPLALAFLIAATAMSKTPLSDTDLSWWSFSPSRCTEKNR